MYPEDADIVKEFHYMESQIKVSVPVEELFRSLGERCGIEDMDAALALKGKSVCIYAEDVELPEGEYFDAELEGLTVLDDENGEELGRLTRVLNYPAHKVYEVRGKREYLIPAVAEKLRQML